MLVQPDDAFGAAGPGAPDVAPQTWFEWIHTLYNPRRFILQRQHLGKVITAPGATNGNTDFIACPEPFFCFGVRSRARVSTAGGAGINAFPPAGYMIGFKQANGNDWFQGQWDASLVTGDIALAFCRWERDWLWPRPLAENEQITVTIDNGRNVANDTIRVESMLVGYVVRTFTPPSRV